LGTFLLVAVFLIAAAALGFAVGWLVRGAKLQGESDRLADDRRARLGHVEGERDRLQAELAAARDDGTAPQRGLGERAAAGDAELEARATRLEHELEQARAMNAEQRAEIERLEASRGELQASPAKVPTSPDLAAAPSAPPIAASAAVAQVSAATQAAPPPSLTRPEGEPDDLKRISGIGPGIERTLHELGIFHFRQIAAFTPENVTWVDRHLRFKGRIEREDWIGQARRLAAES
jgi:predicted flap endonuclease-1-like 5' DNA nuclease